MKKLLAILLCIATLFCFVACSEEDDDDNDRKSSNKKPNKGNVGIVTPEPNAPAARPAEPTEDELFRLEQYYYLCCQCQDLSGDLSQEQLQNLYTQLQEAEDLDYWLGTEYVADYYQNEFGNEGIITDRQTLLNKFTLLEDVLLHYRRASWTDNLGNTETREDGNTFWDYNINGDVCRIQNEQYYTDVFGIKPSDLRFETEYDAEGKPVCTRYYLNSGDVFNMVIYTYNDNDQCVSREYRSNTTSDFVYFTYNDKGQLAQAAWESLFNFTLDYVYDEEGRLIKETYSILASNYGKTHYVTEQQIREYTYDDAGNLQGGAFSQTDYYNQGNDISSILDGTLSFVTDENGRILSETRTYNPKITYPGKSNSQSIPHTVSSETFEYTYGTYYICAE